MKLLSSWIKVGAILVILAVSGRAHFLDPGTVPTDRLIRSAKNYLRLHPREAEAHFIFARVHYLAFSKGRAELLGSVGTNGQPLPAENMFYDYARPNDEWMHSRVLPLRQRAQFAVQAYYAFKEAMRLDATSPIIALGYASLLQEVWQMKAELPDLQPALRDLNVGTLREAFTTALDLASTADKKVNEMPIGGLGDLVTYEAGTQLIALAEKASLSKAEKLVLKRAEAAVKRAKSLPVTVVTPMVFAFQPGERLEPFLAPNVTVDFDLRGYGIRDRWTWVKPELGLLVWDPEETGKIDSARQLFGGYTFQIFWKDGYRALASLDESGDGALTGRELSGLGVWFDLDSDGRSNKNEVTPLRTLNVASISTQATSRDGMHPTNPRGITFQDGRAQRTWDWIVLPVRP